MTRGSLQPVSLSQLEYFVAIAEQGNVSRAALTLRVAQPALSRQLRQLEDELGATLFVRSARGMQLSEPGARFLAHARDILARVGDAREDMEQRKHGPPIARRDR